MIPYYPGCFYSAGESAVGQREGGGGKVAAVSSAAKEVQGGRGGGGGGGGCWGEVESWAAASQMIDGARAAIAGAKVCQTLQAVALPQGCKRVSWEENTDLPSFGAASFYIH